MNRFTVSAEIPASPQAVYGAWLDGEQHGAMTQSPATASHTEGAEFSAHDGYITGRNLERVPGERILQLWRTTQFTEEDPDSSIEVTFEASSGGTLVTLRHWNLPPDQAEDYESGWQDFYFTPMIEYFSSTGGE